jgi:hypothetical protein
MDRVIHGSYSVNDPNKDALAKVAKSMQLVNTLKGHGAGT